jgi:DNA-binding MarR family transcriptional regulator
MPGEPLSGIDKDEITLGVLDAVHGNSALSQRSLSRELGIALGLTNAYLKRCVRKGLVKVSQTPPNRYAYFLTPKGFSEKSRLTAGYLKRSFEFYRDARGELEGVFRHCAAQGWGRAGLSGAGELAEVAVLCAMLQRVDVVGIIDPRLGEARFMGIAVVAAFDDLGAIDALVITDLRRPQAVYESALAVMPAARVFAPKLLKVAPAGGRPEEVGR